MNQESAVLPKTRNLPRFLSAVYELLDRHALVSIILLGLSLRLIASDSRSLQYDDTFSIFLGGRSFAEILSGTAADTMPPLYYFLLHFWLLISREVWVIRLLTVLINIVCVVLLYRLVNHLFGRKAAGWAGLLAAISPLQIYHAQDVRMYSLMLAGQMTYLLFFARTYLPKATAAIAAEQSKPSWWNWVGLVGGGLVAMYSHNAAIFTLVVPDLYLLLRRDWRGLLRLIAAQAVIGLLSLPWVLLVPGQIAKVQRAWSLPRPGIIEVLQAIIMFTASLPLPFILLAIVTVLSLQIFVMLGLETWRGRRESSGVPLLACLLLVPPALFFAASYVMQPIFISRAFLASSLAYYGLAGFVIARTWSKGVGAILAGAFVLAAALSLPSFYTYDSFPRSPYQQAAVYLDKVAQPDSRVIHDNKLSYFPAHFYAPNLPQVFLDDIPGSGNDTFEDASQAAMQIYPQPDIAAAVGSSTDVYFVLFSETFDEYRALGIDQHPTLLWLDGHFHQVDRQVFNDLYIYHYHR